MVDRDHGGDGAAGLPLQLEGAAPDSISCGAYVFGYALWHAMHSSLPTRASFRGPHPRKALRLVLLDVLLRGLGGGATEEDCIVVQDVAVQLAASTGRTRGAARALEAQLEALEAVRKEMRAADSSSGPSHQLRPQSKAEKRGRGGGEGGGQKRRKRG